MNKYDVINAINNFYNTASIALQDYVDDKEVYNYYKAELIIASIIVNKVYDNVITEKDYVNIYNKYTNLLKDVESYLDCKRKGM